MARRTEHPFLSGNYAPVTDETTFSDLTVDGTIPPVLSGRYLRIGPNPIGNAPHPYDWSDGDGMVHAVALHSGRAVSYRNRWIETDAASTRLGTERVPGPRRRGPDTSNTNLLVFGGRVLSLGERALPYELTSTLETICRVDLAGGNRGVSAHPKIDPATGELHLVSSADRSPQFHHVVSARGARVASRAINVPGDALVHDLIVTREHIVFFGERIVGTTPRHGDGVVQWLTTESGRVVHANGYDDDGVVVVHLAGPSLERWTLDRSADAAHQDVIDETPQSFGRINEQLLGSPHRYLYTVGAGPDLPFDGTEIHKHDLVARTRQTYDFGSGRHPGEFLFVDDPQRANEDGGWLLGLVHDDATDRTALIILDADDLDRAAVATVHLPRRIPYGLHGAWLPTPT